MKNFTLEERKTLVKNTNAILNFVRQNASPFLREMLILKFKDVPSYKEIMFIIHPGKKGNIEFSRGLNSTEYYLGDEYDSLSVKREREKRHRYNFFEEWDAMFALIENWSYLKKQLMNKVQYDSKISNVLNSFQV